MMNKYRGCLDVTITGELTEQATSWAGAGLLAELYREAGIDMVTERALPSKKSSKGLKQSQNGRIVCAVKRLRWRLYRGHVEIASG